MFEDACKLHSGICAQIGSLEIRIGDLCKLLDLQILNMEKAVNIAKETLNIRLDSMNEFRGQLSDQVRNFPTRLETNANLDKLELKVMTIEKSINEKFALILKPVMDKLSSMEAMYNQKVGSRMWEIVIVTSLISSLLFLISHYIFKF